MSACPTRFFFHFFFYHSHVATPRNRVGTGRFHDLNAVHHQTLVISVYPGLRGFPRFFLMPFRKKLPLLSKCITQDYNVILPKMTSLCDYLVISILKNYQPLRLTLLGPQNSYLISEPFKKSPSKYHSYPSSKFFGKKRSFSFCWRILFSFIWFLWKILQESFGLLF